MADEEKGTSAWYKVPTWDGSPVTWRSFKREMDWWLCSLDLTGTMKYNLAARWLLRQTGVVRQRGEEFTPKELECVHEVRAIDPQSGEEVILTEADPLAGINKLLAALESINGKTELDKKGELRHQFYQELRRRPGERMSEFCTRFRMLAADLRLEGVTIPNSELGWFLKDKIGLDPIRKQLLDTALQGKESYEEVEGEVLRLFKELHVQDPLHRVSREQVTAFGRFVANRGGPWFSSHFIAVIVFFHEELYTVFSVFDGSSASLSVSREQQLQTTKCSVLVFWPSSICDRAGG